MHKSINKWRKTFSTLTVIAIVLVSGATWLTNIAHAAGGQLYTTVGASTVNPGGTVTVNIRINPGTPTDTVNIVLGYDTSKMMYVGTSYAGSPFDQQFGLSNSGGQVSFADAKLGQPGISSDSFVAAVSFVAATGSAGVGTASFSLAGSNAASSGTQTNPTIGTASSVTFVCASGQTGTPPNCTTPTTTGGGTGTGTTGGTGGTGGTKTTPPPVQSGTSAGTSSGGTGTTSTQAAKPQGTPATVTGQVVQYTRVSITCATKTASTAYIRYGINGNLTTSSPLSANGSSHTITLDPATLLPGMTYSYVVVSTDASGTVSQTSVQTFKTKGMQVTLTVTDKNHHPLKNKTVTLHSDPLTAKTNAKGEVTFTDVPLGLHHVVYAAGKKTYTQDVTVVNNIQTVADAQSAKPQTFLVAYNFEQSSLNLTWLWFGIILFVLVATIVLARTGHLGFALQLRSHNYTAPISAPIVVGSNTVGPQTIDTGSVMNDEQRASMQGHLDAIPNPSQPMPGTSLVPEENSSSSDQINRY